jgi:hypothetical protein
METNETGFENGLRLIRSGVFILLIYLVLTSFAEITELLSDVERKDDFLQSESSVQSEEVSPVCDLQNSQFDFDACQLELLDSKIYSQSLSTFWSFVPVTGIVLVFVGILRLTSDEYEDEETDSNSTGLNSSMIDDLQDNQYQELSSRVLTLEDEVKAHNDKLSSPRFHELLYGAR